MLGKESGLPTRQNLKLSFAILGLLLACYLLWQQLPSRTVLRGPGYTSISPLEPAALASEELILHDVPFQEKQPDFGGEACVAMVLEKLNGRGEQKLVFDLSGVDPVEGRGVVTSELKLACEKIGFVPGDAWYEWAPGKERLFFKQLASQLRQGVLGVFCIREKGAEKFVLAVGIDSAREQIIVHDPSRPEGKNRRISWNDFYQACHLGQRKRVHLKLDLRSTLKSLPPELSREKLPLITPNTS